MEFNTNVPKSRGELKAIAKEKLKGKWGIAILVCLIVMILGNGANISVTIKDLFSGNMLSSTGRSSVNFGGIIQLIIGGPLALGSVTFFLNLFREGNERIEDVFSGFSNFGTAFLVQLLSGIFIMLWTLLLIVPGIIASLSYSMIYFIMRDNPGVSAMDLLKESKKLMDGEKGRLFMIYLSFIGWFLVGIITLGVGFLWIIPYMSATTTAFYEDLKMRKVVTSEYGEFKNQY